MWSCNKGIKKTSVKYEMLFLSLLSLMPLLFFINIIPDITNFTDFVADIIFIIPLVHIKPDTHNISHQSVIAFINIITVTFFSIIINSSSYFAPSLFVKKRPFEKNLFTVKCCIMFYGIAYNILGIYVHCKYA